MQKKHFEITGVVLDLECSTGAGVMSCFTYLKADGEKIKMLENVSNIKYWKLSFKLQ